MNEKNILSLKTRLMRLGFEPSVEMMLRCHICFQPSRFDIHLTKPVDNDSFLFSVHLERGDKDQYELRYYTAMLRKDVVVPSEFASVSYAMQLVDWHSLVKGKLDAMQMDVDNIQSAFDVLGKLQGMGASADVLKYKYWIGTDLEPLIQQLSALKNEWEISERFYFFDENLVISFDDAIRFLSSRWIEKQMVVKKKLLIKKKESGRVAVGGAGGKLLGKNTRRLTRRGADKSSD